MCILLNVKKHEKTFALNVDIFTEKIKNKKCWIFLFRYDMIIKAVAEGILQQCAGLVHR